MKCTFECFLDEAFCFAVAFQKSFFSENILRGVGQDHRAESQTQ